MNIVETFYERLGRPVGDLGLKIRRQDVLRDKKWKIFIKRTRKFRRIPFVDFVLAAGSMALGNVHEASDFDVIVSARFGRIFTARFFCILFFGIFCERREKLTHKEEASDKICFNHFITEKSYRLSPPYNVYWQELYKNLVPLYGDKEKILEFFAANSRGEEYPYGFDDLRHRGGHSLFKRAAEVVWGGFWGNVLENFLRQIQLGRIEKNLSLDIGGFEPRLIYSDRELEFHPDTKRIHDLVS